MPHTSAISRRTLLQSLSALPATAAAAPGPAVLRRQYRADAVVLLGSMPLFTREGIGNGYALAMSPDASGRQFETLQFGAGSDPTRAAGINRLGFLQETRRANGSSYTGFMSVSDEMTFAEIKEVVSNQKETLEYNGISGEVRNGVARSRWLSFETPASWNWSRFSELRAFAENIIRQPKPKGEVQANEYKTTASRSFLSAIMHAITDPDGQSDVLFAYGSGQHRLRAAKQGDPKMARKLAAKGLTQHPERILALKGEVKDLAPGEEGTPFTLWFEKDAPNPLPLRIDFQPKPYIALTFEARGA